MNQVQKIIQNLQALSRCPVASSDLLSTYITEAIENGTPVTLYNWECPPRFLDRAPTGELFVNYSVDLQRVFQGEKIDKFTEIPRVVEKAETEKKVLEKLKKLNFPFRFVKLIADTNAYYLTPESIQILGEENILKTFKDFKQMITQRAAQYPVPVQTYLFTELIEEYKTDYEASYRQALTMLQQDYRSLVKNWVYRGQLARTRGHVGLREEQAVTLFANRTIATYAAEGIVLNSLSQTPYFSNCVWLNIEEGNKRTVEITNCLRRKKDIQDLPMIFV